MLSTTASERLREWFDGEHPAFALVLGSSLGAVADVVHNPRKLSYAEVPGFPMPSTSGHSGQLVIGDVGGCTGLILEGRVHFHETGRIDAMRPVIECFAQLGIEIVVLTNAAGSTRSQMPPGSLMLINDHINFSGTNPLIGETDDAGFISLVDAYDPELSEFLRAAARQHSIDLAEGVYLCNAGPAFETPAEVRMASIIGADAVGMSTVPEVLLARRYGIRVAALSAITNYGAGLLGGAPSHDETKREGSRIVEDLTQLMRGFASRIAAAS